MKLLRSIFMAPTQRRAQRLVERLSLQLTKLYEGSVKDALIHQKDDLIYVQGTGRDLAVELSPEGINNLMNNLPPSIVSILKAEEMKVKEHALLLANTIEYYEREDRLQAPIRKVIRELMIRLLEGEVRKSP
jgi:hypothetical protein